MATEASDIERTKEATVETVHMGDEDSKKDMKTPVTEDLNNERATLLQYKIFNDPIHGPVKLHPLLTKIINTTEFSRLRHLKQLGGACYVYHGAIHTRFEHSIGVCYLAGELVRMLKQNQPSLHIDDKEVLCVEVAALCHDLGHGPFSHMFETRVAKVILDERKVILDEREFKHEKLSQLIFGRIYDNCKDEFTRYGLDGKKSDITAMIHPDKDTLIKAGQKRFLYEIVSNKTTGIDVDKWDYFERDSKYLGIPNGFQTRRLMSLTQVVLHEEQHRICYPDKELQNIYGMFHTRCTLYQRAYHHKTVKAIDQMIADAIIAVKDVPLIHLGDCDQAAQARPHTVTSIVTSIVEETDKAKCGSDVTAYLALTDNILELIMHGDCAHLTSEARKLITRLEERDIYHRIAKKIISRPKDQEGKKKTLTAKQIEVGIGEQLQEKFNTRRYYIEVIAISHGSEDKEGDPIDKVLFFSKANPVKVLTENEVKHLKSELVIPRAFYEHEIRLYRKEASNEAEDEQMTKAFEKWCDDTLPKKKETTTA